MPIDLEYRSPAHPPMLPWWIVVAATFVFVAVGFGGLVVVRLLLVGELSASLIAGYVGLIVGGVGLLEYSVLRECNDAHARAIGVLAIVLTLLLFVGCCLWVYNPNGQIFTRGRRAALVMAAALAMLGAATSFVAIAHFAFARRVRRFAHDRE